jgi:hypothetical protein
MAEAADPAVVAALRPVLEDVARRRATITYRELARAAGVAPPHSIHKTTLALESLMRADAEAGRPLLAAVAVGKTGRPRPGFFQTLRALGRYHGPDTGPDAEAAHDRERAAVTAAWAG